MQSSLFCDFTHERQRAVCGVSIHLGEYRTRTSAQLARLGWWDCALCKWPLNGVFPCYLNHVMIMLSTCVIWCVFKASDLFMCLQCGGWREHCCMSVWCRMALLCCLTVSKWWLSFCWPSFTEVHQPHSFFLSVNISWAKKKKEISHFCVLLMSELTNNAPAPAESNNNNAILVQTDSFYKSSHRHWKVCGLRER